MAIGSRRYFGMMNPAPLPVAIFAESLAAAMNQNAASWRHAPSGTAIEKRVIRWLCDLFGLPETSFGTFTAGGSLANITGLKLAINRALGRDLSQVENLEPPGPEMAQLTFYVSGQGHYSFDKAVDLLGLGRGQLRKMPQDELYRVDLDALEAAIWPRTEAAGLKPCCIIGIAGTTNTGSIDKLDKLAELARRHDCWFHVDAAYGGAVMLSEMYGTMLRGIDQADSITVDPHKWFYMPFSAGGILVRDGDFLRKSFLVHPEYYMEKVLAEGDAGGRERARAPGAAGPPRLPPGRQGQLLPVRDPGQPPPQRPEAVAGLPHGGPPAVRRLGGEGHRAGPDPGGAHAAAARISGSSVPTPWASAISAGSRGTPPAACGSTTETNDQLNRELQDLVEREGDAWFSFTVLAGRVALRVNVENRLHGAERHRTAGAGDRPHRGPHPGRTPQSGPLSRGPTEETP